MEAHVSGLSLWDEKYLNNIRIFKKKKVMNNMDKKIQEAIVQFGQLVVDVVLDMVRLSDEDGAYSLFRDYGMYECCDCVKFLYFKD